MSRAPCVYIVSNHKCGTLYVGVTSNIRFRVWQHRQRLVRGFTHKYRLTKLVYFEFHEDMPSAIEREKALKRWRRDWKIQLIESQNPGWKDLYLSKVLGYVDPG